MRQWVGSALVQIILVAYSAPSHYLNQCWVIFNWTPRNKIKSNSNQNTRLFIHENALQNVFFEMAGILSRGRWVSPHWGWKGCWNHSMGEKILFIIFIQCQAINSHLHSELFGGIWKLIFAYHVIYPLWEGAGSCKPASWRRFCFLHDRLWISPWMKSIFNELDITLHVIASQLSGLCYCDVINNRLWRHQQNVNPVSEAWGRCVKVIVFIIIVIVVMSCKKWNNVCTLMTNCFCPHSSVILVFISLVDSQLGK